jgi:hypothetical protein
MGKEDLEDKVKYKYRSDKDQEWRKGLINAVKRNRFYQFLGSMLIRGIYLSSALFDPESRKFAQTPEFWKVLFDREYRTGFSEGSILQNPLYVPGGDGFSLRKENARAGSWVGYDFKNQLRYKRRNVQNDSGKLTSFILDEIRNNPKDLYTPDYTLDIFNFYHFLCFEHPSMTYLEEQGVVEKRTYREAYQRVGRYEQYARAMDFFGITEEPVYQITPKGNGLVILTGEGGKKVEKKKESRVLIPSPVN